MRKTLRAISLIAKIAFDLVLLFLLLSYGLIMTILLMLKKIAKITLEIFLFILPVVLILIMFFVVLAADTFF